VRQPTHRAKHSGTSCSRERASTSCRRCAPSSDARSRLHDVPLCFARCVGCLTGCVSTTLLMRNDLVDVVGQIAQPKSGDIRRPVAVRRNRRYFYSTAHNQRGSDCRSCLDLSWFHRGPGPRCSPPAARKHPESSSARNAEAVVKGATRSISATRRTALIVHVEGCDAR